MTDREIDRQLVARAQRGDKQAFELLVEKYQRKLARLLSRFIRGRESAGCSSGGGEPSLRRRQLRVESGR